MKSQLFLIGACAVMFTSCISKKKLMAEQDKYAKLNTFYMQVQDDLRKCRDDEAESAKKKALLQTEITGLNKQIAILKENNNTIIGQLKDLSVTSSSQAQSIQKSLENVGSYHKYHSKSKLRNPRSVDNFSHKKPRVKELNEKQFKLNREENHGCSIYDKKILVKNNVKQIEEKHSILYYTPNRRPASAQKSR